MADLFYFFLYVINCHFYLNFVKWRTLSKNDELMWRTIIVLPRFPCVVHLSSAHLVKHPSIWSAWQSSCFQYHNVAFFAVKCLQIKGFFDQSHAVPVKQASQQLANILAQYVPSYSNLLSQCLFHHLDCANWDKPPVV